MIRTNISGKTQTQPIKILTTPEGEKSAPKDIANTLGKTFERNSSSQHYTPKFQKHKEKAEKKRIEFGDGAEEDYNKDLTREELLEALDKAHDSAAGPDEIHSQFLKHGINSQSPWSSRPK